MTSQKFYVYVYLRRDGSPYYVGKGQNARWRAHHRVEVPSPDRVIFLITNTTEEWAHFIEMEFIDQHGRLNDGTGILENWTDGGEGTSGCEPWNKGKKLSEETKQKISSGLEGRTHNEESKRKMSESAKNRKDRKPLSAEHKQKLSDVNKGQTRSEESKRKMSEAQLGERNHMYGKNRSDETKRKISDALRGRKKPPMTEEQKKKISNTLKGRSKEQNSNEYEIRNQAA